MLGPGGTSGAHTPERHSWSSCERLALDPGVWVALAHSAYLGSLVRVTVSAAREFRVCVYVSLSPYPCRQADLTQQFYSVYAKEHVLQRDVRCQWRELCNLPEDQQLLEKGGL